MKDQFYKHIENLQDSITSKIEEVDGLAKFKEEDGEIGIEKPDSSFRPRSHCTA